MNGKKESSNTLPAAVRESLETALPRISNELAARELWVNRFTAADRRKFDVPWPEVWKKHNSIIEMWHVARGTPTSNACIVEIAHALGFINGTQRESLLDALGASTRSGLASGGRGRSTAATPHWNNDTKKLSYQNQTVRKVVRPKQAYNIVTILNAFQDAGWPHRIDDPLVGRKPSDDTRRRDISNLNKGLRKGLLKFACDGNGTGFVWNKIEKAKSKKPAKRLPR